MISIGEKVENYAGHFGKRNAQQIRHSVFQNTLQILLLYPDTFEYLFEVFMYSGHGVPLAGSNNTFWSHWSFPNKACCQVFYDIIKKMECRLWAAKPR
jgi:hypothetical protein